MVTHRLFAFHIFHWPTQSVGLLWWFFFFFYWPTQRVGLSWLSFFLRPTERVGLLHCSQMDLIGFSLLAFPHAREILLKMLTIHSNRKLDTIHFLEHVCVPRQNLINLIRPMPSWRPFTKLFVFSSQWQYCLPNQISNSEILRLDLLVVCTGNF